MLVKILKEKKGIHLRGYQKMFLNESILAEKIRLLGREN